MKRSTPEGQPSLEFPNGFNPDPISDLEKEIERLRNARPELAHNDGALRELAKISLSARKNNTSYKTTPYPPLDN